MLRRLNSVLPELILGIIVYGAIVQLIGVWWSQDKILYTTGLWMGVATAIGMAVHMAIVIEDSVTVIAENKIKGRIIMYSLLRYVVVVVVFFMLAYFKLGNVIMCFIGVMGLKISAYLQPFTHRFISRLRGNDRTSPKEKLD